METCAKLHVTVPANMAPAIRIMGSRSKLQVTVPENQGHQPHWEYEQTPSYRARKYGSSSTKPLLGSRSKLQVTVPANYGSSDIKFMGSMSKLQVTVPANFGSSDITFMGSMRKLQATALCPQTTVPATSNSQESEQTPSHCARQLRFQRHHLQGEYETTPSYRARK